MAWERVSPVAETWFSTDLVLLTEGGLPITTEDGDAITLGDQAATWAPVAVTSETWA